MLLRGSFSKMSSTNAGSGGWGSLRAEQAVQRMERNHSLNAHIVEAFENKLLLGETETKRIATLTQLLLKWAATDADPAQQDDS